MAGDSELLLGRQRGGNEEAFAELACRYHGSLVRLAAAFVPGRALAEDVARDTWLGMLDDLNRFDGRAPVKTWLFRILISRADRAAGQTGRSALAGDAAARPGRFVATGG